MTYKEQCKEIKALTAKINSKAKAFAKKNDQLNTPYFEDLLDVIQDLKSIDNFLK